MYQRQKRYKQKTLLVLMITVAALIVCAASLNLKRSFVPTGTAPLTSRPAQSLNDYYSSNETVSQESEASRGQSQRSTPAPASTGKNSGQTASTAGQPVFYLVTVHDGKIGVFENGDKSQAPVLTADVNVYLLPQKDMMLLKEGIFADSLAAVRGILEDYQ